MSDWIFNYPNSVLNHPSQNDINILCATGILIVIMVCALFCFHVYSTKYCHLDEVDIQIQQESNKRDVDIFYNMITIALSIYLPFIYPMCTVKGKVNLWRFFDTVVYLIFVGFIVFTGIRLVDVARILDRSKLFVFTVAFLSCSILFVIYRSLIFIIFGAKTLAKKFHDPNDLESQTKVFKLKQSKAFNHSIFNWIQIVIIVIEFGQIISFPLRALFNHVYFQSIISDSSIQDEIIAFFQIGFLFSDSSYISTLRIRLTFYFIFLAYFLLAALLINFWISDKLKDGKLKSFCQKIKIQSRKLIFLCLTVFPISFIPVITTFVKVFGCLIDWQTPVNGAKDETIRCYEFVVVAPEFYAKVCIVSLLLSMCLITVILCCSPVKHEKGVVSFSSSSTLFLKLGSIVYSLSFLILRKYPMAKAVTSLLVLLLMCFYNIYFKSCFIQKLNNFRSTCLISAFYVCLVISIFINPENTLLMYNYGERIFIILGVGVTSIFALFFICLYFQKLRGIFFGFTQ